MTTHVVIYAAKSTEDKHGSIPRQVADCRELADREGWEVAGEFTDEAFSAYKGNRGPGLARAKALAVRLAEAHGGAILFAQDTDRFARGAGDAPGAADHLGELFFALRRQRVALWSVRSGKIDGIRAVVEGERGNDESERKSDNVRKGLRGRAERGLPVGPVPIGYRVEHRPDGTSVRVIDPATRVIVELIFDVIENGGSLGDAARQLNALGHTGKRGGPFSARTVRDIVGNLAYSGERGYPRIIEPERQRRVIAGLRRMDPAAVQRRRGRPPGDERYFLRGISFCRHCGASLYTRPLAIGRTYICANTRTSTGLCNVAAIPADLIEGHVLSHVEAFVGSAERWLAERRDEHRRALDAQQDAARRLRKAVDDHDRHREVLMARYDELASEGRAVALLALEAVERHDADRAELVQRLADAEAIASEHDADEHDAHTSALVSSFRERMTKADGPSALNTALASSLNGLWASVDAGRLRVEFELADPPEFDERHDEKVSYLLTYSRPAGPTGERVCLPEVGGSVNGDGRGR